MMTLHVKTNVGNVVADIKSNVDAVRFLRNLASLGIKCIRWEMIECSRNG